MIPTVIKVLLSDDPSSIVEVPITPNTTASDVVECCKEPGEQNCHLAELWRGRERSVSANEKPYTILQQWGSHAPEVRFCLKHVDVADMGRGNGDDRKDLLYNSCIIEDGKVISTTGADVSLAELKEIATRQQQQIEQQQQTLVGKEQRLRFLKHQMQQQQIAMNDNDKLQRLRERAEMQEAKLRKIRALQGKVEQKRYQNTTISTELDAVKSLFEEKQHELATAMSKVQELTNQLDELRSGSVGNMPNTVALANGSGFQHFELDKLKQEMEILNRMNEEQQKRLMEQRQMLQRRNEDAGDLDRRIEELTQRLHQKRMENGSESYTNGVKSSSSVPTKMHTIVAAVEPVVKQTDPNVAPNKYQQSMYRQGYGPQVGKGMPTGNSIINRIDQQPSGIPQRGQPEGYNSTPLDQNTGNKFQQDPDAYKKSYGMDNFQRPQSAMAQLFPDVSHSQSKTDSLTAKVRPMYQKSPQEQDRQTSPNVGYYPLNSQGPANLFAYKPPPATSNYSQSNVSVLPNGNIKYTQAKLNDLPPPYPSSADVDGQGGRPYHSSQGPAIDRSITVDIEALRRKFAHAPRPLKKRSSITEPERPQGPNIPKLLYDQIYKKADTPFYRPQVEQSHRSTPPPPYAEPSMMSAIPEKPVEVEQLAQPSKPTFKEAPPKPAEKPKRVTKRDESVGEQDDQRSESSSLDEIPPKIQVPKHPSKIQPKGILKPVNQAPKMPGRRIRFDPLALLLDASLEGEFELVKEIITEVKDPSGANDEGITALHNAVCAGHFELVRFLVHYGSDINASDTDGWTPLHCAASCNNLAMARFLVENGACIFAATLSDGETAADKCEQLDEGYLPCSEYLYGIQEKLGVVRQGQVYALFDYQTNTGDELSFTDGDYMTIVKRGDEVEREWWWACIGDSEGYVPRNLLGMWPRIKPKDDDN
uniref:Apoptosis-stimulating of p53 protein 1-like n=1 Tax=Phallusia mammillata TaxID=59560 RepID=A0A6F9DPY1_9ASCI|nr:apoptosis-stimulating of p53 protein 1-like [Phallusia mammillata]